MSNPQFKVYRYRWAVLATFMFINLTIQVLWISYASITGPAARYYGASDLQIGLLAMSFMIVFIPLSLPVSWVIDTYGFRIAVSVGATLMGIFEILRGLVGDNYSLVLLCTIGIAIAQPFLLNAWTKVAARWFALEERATAVGLATIANLLGTALGLILTPILILSLPIPSVQLIYGVLAAFSALLFIAFAREKPLTPPCPPGMEVRALMLDGLKHAIRVKQLWLFIAVYFIGLGLFNGLTTWVENIVRPRGFSPTQAGVIGGLLLIGGIIGAFILSNLSDKLHKRQVFLFLAVLGSIPGLLGVTFASRYGVICFPRFRWVSSWSAPPRLACSILPKSHIQPRKAPRTDCLHCSVRPRLYLFL